MEQQLNPNLKAGAKCSFTDKGGGKTEKTEGDVLYFAQGEYNAKTVGDCKKNGAPPVIFKIKMEHLHKATTDSLCIG